MNLYFSCFLTHLFLLFLTVSLSAQQAEDIHFITKTGYKGKDFYTTQSELWKQEVNKPGAPAKAWFNYYLASDYAFIGSGIGQDVKRSRLGVILKGLQKTHPDSFERWILEGRYKYSDPEPVLKAMNVKPDAPEPYRTLMRQAILAGEQDTFRDYTEKLYQTASIHPGLMDYNYNVLMSAAQNGVLLTNGDNDTYPAWLLQEAKGVRRDIVILNVYLAKGYPAYLKRLLKNAGITPFERETRDLSHAAFVEALCEHINPQKPVFLAATVQQSITDPIKDKLYSTGLAYRYSADRFDNLSEIRKNWKQKYRLDSLTNSWYTEAHISANLVDQLNMNYLPPALSLATQARKNGNLQEADELTSLAKTLAERAGQTDDFQNYLNKQSNE